MTYVNLCPAETNIISMKVLSYILMMFVVTSCISNAQTIQGNGSTKSDARTVSNFTGVASDGAFDVTITHGESTGVKVEADENLLPYIETVVEDNTLVIRPKENYSLNSKNKMKVTLSMTTLKTLALNGSGNITAHGAFKNNGETDVAVNGSGDIALSFESFDALNAAVNGSGNMKLSGNARDFSAGINGSGDIDAYGVTVDNASVAIGGSGNVNVTSNKSVTASISGSGNVNYKGNATQITEQSSGSGKVRKS